MTHFKYTIRRGNVIYYNRRVPLHAVHLYGSHVRHALSSEDVTAAAYARRLTDLLDEIWSLPKVTYIDLPAVIAGFAPKKNLLSEVVDEYLMTRDIDPSACTVATRTLIKLVGDRDVASYTRDDAKLLMQTLQLQGNKTATVRRKTSVLAAIFNHAYAEFEVNKRNPFARLHIPHEGKDASKRGTFTIEQLKQGYQNALTSGSHVQLLMPLLGETGCRIAEIAGLELNDINMHAETINIRPNSIRRLKTRTSNRIIPLVGYAKKAMTTALQHASEQYLYPQYVQNGICSATVASNALGFWMKKEFGLTSHSLRHTFRDRLRNSNCPLELIDQISGWSSVNNVGSSYGSGFHLDKVREQLLKIAL